MSREKCPSCDNPLGNTIDKCHECGGKTYRAGPRETGNQWRVLLGLGG